MALKVLITGGSGQVGRELVTECSGRAEISEVYAPSSATLNLGDRNSVIGAVLDFKPDWIIHAGAWTQVDACEEDPSKAYLINALGTRFVAEAAEAVASRVLYISTDYVFDGNGKRPYLEWDPVGPRTIYGASKLAGERELRSTDTIVRTSWVMGEYGHNMAKTLIRLASSEGEHRFVDDQIGIPTIVSDMVKTICDLVIGGYSGIFHISNSGPTTWYDIACYVFDLLGKDPGRIIPIKTSDLSGFRAPRPHYSVLDSFALRGIGMKPLPSWQESLARLVSKLSVG